MTLRDLLRRRPPAHAAAAPPARARVSVALAGGRGASPSTRLVHSLGDALGDEFNLSALPGTADPDIVVCLDLSAAEVGAVRAGHPRAVLLATTHGWPPELPERVVELLRAGADSCVANPSTQELAAHVLVLARRRAGT